MEEHRVKKFMKMNEEELKALTCEDFTTSEIEELIAETPMRDEDKRLAVMKFIKDMTYEEIAEKMQIDVKTVIRRKEKISLKMKLTCFKIFYNED